ncbi:hypothetical protein LOZ58_002111 [Ophidiomyces ophidiicola]|nr:hypothetical protein LOZ65_004556 [Ophidiomyces ophidiicola]KAI1963279.1 hypothetical protein LOZ58_002111 [Ophidiomyces ophidiicola]
MDIPSSALKTSVPAVHASSSPAPSYMSYTPPPGSSPNPRHLAIALHHARNIQARKDTEAIILSHIEHLMALPSTADADPAAPSETDASIFTSSLIPFQPSDYDNLILERNIDGRCGYALCPKNHRKEDPKTEFRILWGPKGSGLYGRGRTMKIVPTNQLEKWCSEYCAERALFVRVQLNEEPAWERINKKNVNILLMEEWQGCHLDKKRKQASLSMPIVEENLRNLSIRPSATEKHVSLNHRLNKFNDEDDSKRLALERGDSPTIASEGRLPIPIIENDPTAASAPTLQLNSIHGGSIEGFRPENHNYSRQDAELNDQAPNDDVMRF